MSSSFLENVMCTALSTYYRRVYKTLALIGLCFFGQLSTKRSIQPKLAMPSFYATLPFLLFECGMWTQLYVFFFPSKFYIIWMWNVSTWKIHRLLSLIQWWLFFPFFWREIQWWLNYNITFYQKYIYNTITMMWKIIE